MYLLILDLEREFTSMTKNQNLGSIDGFKLLQCVARTKTAPDLPWRKRPFQGPPAEWTPVELMWMVLDR
jgi:hypothetical protein